MIMKTLRFLLFLVISLLLVTCKKEPDIKPVFEIETEVVDYYTSSAEITVQFSYNADLKYVKAYLSESVEMTAPQVATAELNSNIFVVKFYDLQANTKYYYQFEYSNGVDVNKTDIKSFKTKDYSQPTVETIEIIDITQTAAKCNVKVVDNGGAAITERGICWSSHQTPTINDSHMTSEGDIGSFTCEIIDLVENTRYYVRAYAINSCGISYGDQITFLTLHTIVIPTLTTNSVTHIKDITAVSGGNITSDGYGTISSMGVCWSQSETPTINDPHTTLQSGETGLFQCDLTGLTATTTYYVRAYAINEAGVGYGEQQQFTTTVAIPEGALIGVFTACDKQIMFSKGNLQYQASSNTWRFAENQYDFIGSNNQYISSYYNGWIDLFGWGTSGYNHGAVCYQPWSTSTTYSDYYAYGESDYNLYDQTGIADWGYNPISNGGNIENQWRTLSKDEWDYILFIRDTPSGIRYAKATVNNIEGLILLPDNWNSSYYELVQTNVYFSDNVINLISWINIFEENGAVFLPAAEYREGTTYKSGKNGCYWSTTNSGNNNARVVSFSIGNNSPSSNSSNYRYKGYSVRLIRDIK